MVRAIRQQQPDAVFHLGDCERDTQRLEKEFPDLPLYRVCGNCDREPVNPEVLQLTLDGVKFFLTHGHRYSVHYGTDRLQELIKYDGYDIVMYGHTHVQNLERYGGAYIVNPGSLAYPRDGMNGKYMLLEFDQHGTPFFAENELKPKRRMRSIFEDMWGDREE